MESLVYISTATTDTLRESDVRNILAVSRKNNKSLDLSGVLLHAEGGFIQVLEGPEHAIDQTYKRILCDQRHANIITLYREKIKSRTFPNWTMASQDIQLATEHKGLFKLNEASLSDLSLENARREVFLLLKTFLQVHSPHIAA